MPNDAMADAVVFDCYGTLVRVTDQRAVARRISALVGGRLQPSPMTVDRPLVEIVREAAPDTPESEIELLEADLAAEVRSVRMLPGAQDAIDRLRAAGHVIAIASNLARDYADPLRLITGVDHRFLSFELGLAKPDPRFFAAVLAGTGTEPSRTVMIGDSPRSDVQGAQAVGMRAILILREGSDGASGFQDVSTAAALPELWRPQLS